MVWRSRSARRNSALTAWRRSSSRTNSMASPTQPAISSAEDTPSTQALRCQRASTVSLDCATFTISG